jgi:predicted PurR-regulated permease PerM
MGLITWIVMVVTILAIIGLGWNVFISGVYKGVQKIMGNSSMLNKITKNAQQFVGNITKNGSEEKISKRPPSNNLNSNVNVQ